MSTFQFLKKTNSATVSVNNGNQIPINKLYVPVAIMPENKVLQINASNVLTMSTSMKLFMTIPSIDVDTDVVTIDGVSFTGTTAKELYDSLETLFFLGDSEFGDAAQASATLDHFIYNPVTDKLEADRAIETTLNSLFLGEQHKMSSGSENIYFTNLTSKVNWYPVWGGLKDQSVLANQNMNGVYNPSGRVFSDYGVVGLGGSPVDNTSIAYDGDNFFSFNISGLGITTRIAEEIPSNVRLKYELSVNGTAVYNQFLEHNGLSINEDLNWYFDHPLDIVAGSTNHASITKVDVDENPLGLLLVCQGDDGTGRYQTNVINRLFDDKDVAFKEDITALLSGSTYKGAYDASTDLPSLPTGTDVLGDFYRVSAPGNGFATGDIRVFNGTTYDHIAAEQVTQTDILTSGIKVHDIYVKADYIGAVSNGSILYPYSDIHTAVSAASDGDSIYMDGIFNLSAEIILPTDKSLFFYGSDNSCIQFASYSDGNGSLMYFNGTDNTKELKFNNIVFKNAGGYGLYTKKTAKITIEDCEFINNGWDGTQINTVVPSATFGLLGYDSDAVDLQAFYAGSHASNGGAMRIQESTQLLIIGNTVKNNLRGIRVQDCGINGGGVISRNQSMQNIESGIYIAAGALGGCHNITTTMNATSYNANNGLLVIGGINNKFSQNEVNGNWNAGFCAWGAANSTLRDCGLYDNNRSVYNGIGNTGDAKASIQINEAYNLLGTQISLNPAFRFIAEILDTQVHYTGLGSNADKVGFLVTSGVGALPDNPKNIIKIDDVGFIGQDYAIDLSEVDVTNLRLSLGDNSYQSIGVSAVKAPLAGNYSELPFSNHVMEVPSVDVVVDTLKQTLSLREGVGGNTINVYAINELQSVISGSTIQILQANTDKIQLRGLTQGNIYINGVLAGNTLSSANDSLNAAFGMDLVEYKDVLVNEVGINGDESEGGSLPAIANNWYISYGSQSGTQNTGATIGNNFKNFQPFYNGEALEKGHEFIWTPSSVSDYIIGTWGAAEGNYSAANALISSNWSVGFFYSASDDKIKSAESSGVNVENNGESTNGYSVSNNQLALRFGQDNYLYLFEVVAGGYTLIGKSNSTIAGVSVMIQFGGYMNAVFPVMTERTETWEIVHDLDGSENGEWSNGLEDMTVIKSRMSFSPGEKIIFDLNHFGRNESIGFGYLGASTGVNNADQDIVDRIFYNNSELLKAEENASNGSVWTWNTASTGYYDPNGDGSNVGYWNGNGVNLGLISLRYKSDNSVELWHETNNELIATKVTDFDGTSKNIYFGSSENNHTADRIPTLVKYSLTADDEVEAISSWWYIDSPDGSFYYPLFQTEAESNAVDIIEGGSGTSHTHTFADDLSAKTWYMPDTSGVHAGSAAPQGGVFGNSINVVWNEQVTGEDASYAPTFNNITYLVQEGSAINIQYKPMGDTNTYNVTNVPTGYADNGYAIIGTAEDISNGYGQSVQHTINVTKANAFGSVTGTITVNVLADLAGNEFTIIDKEDGTIKFTQDGGITELDFNTVTFNAGSTYKFYLDHYSIESSDGLSVVDSSGNVLLGSEGLSNSGNSGDAGAYMQYVIPADVAPGKFLRYYDNDTSANYTDIPMILAGSTYSVDVTGVTSEGPEDLSLTSEALNDHWYSVDETLSAGERIILNGAFLTDVHNELQIGSSVLFGIKDGAWANTQDGNSSSTTGFEYDLCVKFKKTGATGGTVNVMQGGAIQGANVFYITAMLADYNAIIEITADGNNIRMGVAHSSQNASTDIYSDWNAAKSETGDQGYGLTSIDVMAFYDKAGATVAFDYDNVDWTELSEISTPVAAAAGFTSTTPYTKAVEFNGSSNYMLRNWWSNSWNTIGMKLMNNTDGTDMLINANGTKTSNSATGNSRPFMTAIVFNCQDVTSNGQAATASNDRQYLWFVGRSPNTVGGGKNISLYIENNGDLYLDWGGSSGVYDNNQLRCKIDTLSSDTWYGLNIAYTGARISAASLTPATMAQHFDIRLTDSFGDMGTNKSVSGSWTVGSTATTNSAPVSGTSSKQTIGAPNQVAGSTGNFFRGKIASHSITTLRAPQSTFQNPADAEWDMPNDTEIQLFMLDNRKWTQDYRITPTTTQRGPAGSYYNFPGGETYSYIMAQGWEFGDGPDDVFPNYKNASQGNDNSYSIMQFKNGGSNNQVNVSIPGLS